MDRDWTRAVYCITGPDGGSRGQGTGFACAREGGDLLLVTCWHVVREIGPDQLRVQGLAPDRVCVPGPFLGEMEVREVEYADGAGIGT